MAATRLTLGILLGLFLLTPAQAATVAVLKSDGGATHRRLASVISDELATVDRVTIDLSTNPSLEGSQALLGGPPAAVVAIGDVALSEARTAFPGVPVVYVDVRRAIPSAPDAVRVSSRPDPAAVAERLTQLLPSARRVGMIRRPQDRDPWWDDAVTGFERAGLELRVVDVMSDAEVPNALARIYPTTDAVWLLPDERLLPPAVLARVQHDAILQREILIGHSRAQMDAPQPPPLVVLAQPSMPEGVVVAERVKQLLAHQPVTPGYAPPTLVGDREVLRSCGAIVNQRTAAAVDEWVR